MSQIELARAAGRLPRLGRAELAVLALLAVAFVAVPAFGSSYLLDAILTPFLVLSLAALGLNLLTGYGGLVSLGSAAFMAIGAFAAFDLSLFVPGLPIIAAVLGAGLVTAAAGLAFGLPSLRLRGFYLAVSTLAAQFFVQWTFTKFGWFSNYSPSGVIDAPPLRIGALDLDSSAGRYLFALAFVVLLTVIVHRLVSSEAGEALLAVRDNETAARIIGVRVLRTKLLAFAVSSFIIGVAGALWAFAYLRTVEPFGFNLDRSFQLLFIIIIGGLATIRGAFFGAALIVLTPILLSRLGGALLGSRFDSGTLDMCEHVLVGVLILVFLIAEPKGLAALVDRAVSRVKRPSTAS